MYQIVISSTPPTCIYLRYLSVSSDSRSYRDSRSRRHCTRCSKILLWVGSDMIVIIHNSMSEQRTRAEQQVLQECFAAQSWSWYTPCFWSSISFSFAFSFSLFFVFTDRRWEHHSATQCSAAYPYSKEHEGQARQTPRLQTRLR